MKPPVLLRMTTPAGPAFEIPYHDLGPRNQTPALALVGGIHGNELNGIFVLARLAGLLALDSGGTFSRSKTRRPNTDYSSGQCLGPAYAQSHLAL